MILRRIGLAFVVALGLVTGISSVSAGESIIATGKSADLATLRAWYGKKFKISAIFGDSERAILRKYGRVDLGESLRIDLGKSSREMIEMAMRKKIRAAGLRIELESDRRLKLFTSGDPLLPDAWGISNNGALRRIYTDNFNSTRIQGVKGEDVNVLGLSSNEGKGILVAVLDSGVDTAHPELAHAIRRKPLECANFERFRKCMAEAENAGTPTQACEKKFSALDADGNGYPLDCEGWNFTAKGARGAKHPGNGIVREDVGEGTGHGTKVAGIIAATAGNGIGIRGVAPQAKILPVKVLSEAPGEATGGVATDESASALISTVVRGMLYAVSEKADVANLSLGWNGRADSPLMREAVALAQEQGMLVVAAAGNDSTDALVFPCQYSGVVCVGAHDPDGRLSEFTNFGSGVDIAAPGFAILSSVQDDVDPKYFTDRQGYDFDSGTSFASPFVAGAAAILRSQGYSAAEATARLLAGARKPPISPGKVVLSGNLDVRGALAAAPAPYFVPENKGVHPTIWNRATNRADVSIGLRNIWKSASRATVKVSLSKRDQGLGQIRLSRSSFTVSTWKPGETKTLRLALDILDPKVTSDAALVLEIRAESGKIQTLRIPLQISVVLDERAALPGARILPLAGTVRPEAMVFTVASLDGRPEQDYIAIEPTDTDWKIQIIREESKNGKSRYIVGRTFSFVPPEGASPRLTQRLDVNLDGRSEYVFTSYVPSNEEDEIPYFRFDYRDENGKDVLPSYTFKNRTSILQLEKFQWLRSGKRLVQTWTDVGLPPEAARNTRYDPWNPNAKDEEEPRLYYHDPSASDGVRTVALAENIPADLPKGLLFLSLLNQSPADRKAGRVSGLLTEQGDYVARFFVATLTEATAKITVTPLETPKYRNLQSLEPVKIYGLDPSGITQVAGSGFAGISGTRNQRISAVVPVTGGYRLLDQQIAPQANSDTAYKAVAAFVEGPAANPKGIAAYAQANYELLYRDPTTNRTLLTSLRRYTFLAAALFERTFVAAVAESNGERLGAVQIPDGFGAYPGAEVIVPLRKNGVSVDLIRPAALRIQMASDRCDWLARTEATAADPSAAVYFCGDRFIRVPYRF
jgi:subtilisin family serine protease